MKSIIQFLKFTNSDIRERHTFLFVEAVLEGIELLDFCSCLSF